MTDHENLSFNDLLMGAGGAKGFKFENHGDSITGTVVQLDRMPRKYPPGHRKEGEQVFYEKSGKPAYQLVITLDTDLRDKANPQDNGQRRVFIKEYSQGRDALAKELRDKKMMEGLPIGALLTMKYTGDGESVAKGFSGEKQYSFTVVSVANAALTAESKPEPAAAKSSSIADRLRADGLPEALAELLGDDPAPELYEAVKARHGK